MNNKYTPDRWMLISMKRPEGAITKILSGWYGGYLNGDSWRLSSGVTKIEDKDDHYLIHNHSGSVYTCYKQVEGFSSLTSSIYHSLLSQAMARESEGITIELQFIDDYLKDHPIV
jgi:hypothetical protein